MPTAIVYAYTSEGIIIGADGRRVIAGKVESDTVQKIFFMEFGKSKLAYAWSGSVRNESGDGAVFDFNYLTDFILKNTNMTRKRSFSELVDSFTHTLYILTLQSFGKIADSFPKKEIARVLFLGYFDGTPCVAKVYVEHDGVTILEPQVKYLPPPMGMQIFSGSNKACEIFKLSLREPWLRKVPELVREYIELCFIHRDSLEGENPIGGHIHVGQLTTDRFSWVYPPIPN